MMTHSQYDPSSEAGTGDSATFPALSVSRYPGQRVNQRRVRLVGPLGSNRSPKGLVNIGRPTSVGCEGEKFQVRIGIDWDLGPIGTDWDRLGLLEFLIFADFLPTKFGVAQSASRRCISSGEQGFLVSSTGCITELEIVFSAKLSVLLFSTNGPLCHPTFPGMESASEVG
jgi:hypothetical protein